MKQFTKLMAMLLFTAATQYSCINDADVAIPDKTQSDSNGNVALFLEIPNVPASRSAESSGVTEEGSKEEYAVKTLTVYFFDSATKTFVESQPLENITLAGTSGQKIHYTANKITMKPGTYNVFAIANGEAITADIATQDKFLGAIDKVTYSAGKIPSVPERGFVMTNRGAANLNVEVSKPTDSDKVTDISISLERVVAKIEVTQTQETFPLKDPAGKTYCTVKLNNFRMLNLATEFYTFRHTAVLTSLQEPDSYTDENFGNINDNDGYVIDPYFFKKTVEGAKDFKNEDGFAIENPADVGKDSIPQVEVNQKFYNVSAAKTEHFTAPPKPYSEDTLLAAMETAGNKEFEEDTEKKGLGTPATRAGIIEKLIASRYAVRKGKQILPTEDGKVLIEILPDFLKSASMTAEWENQLLEMEQGRMVPDQFMAGIEKLLSMMLNHCDSLPEEETRRFQKKESMGTCPVCGSLVYEGKKNFYCGNRECNFCLWKENKYLQSMEKDMDARMAAELLKNGSVRVKDLYSRKKDMYFEADLHMDADEKGRVTFSLSFPEKKPTKKHKRK